MMYICGGNIEHMNKYLSAENKTSMFCTFFLGVLDLKTHLLSYCNAGSELPILINNEVSLVSVEHNLALGLMGDMEYKHGEIQLSPGDVLLRPTTSPCWPSGLWKTTITNK